MSSTGSCFDIGITVRSALSRFESGGEAEAGSTDPQTAGNGSIMRLAPVPMFYHNDADDAVKYSAESSRTTHGAKSCIDACRYFGGLIWGALNGVDKEHLLSAGFCPVKDKKWVDLSPEIHEIAQGSFKRKEPPEIKGTGYVVKSLEAALWAFYKTEDFRSGCLMAVNLGDDADTTGAVYGQLAGAYYGIEGIPSEWVAKIKDIELIHEMALALHQD